MSAKRIDELESALRAFLSWSVGAILTAIAAICFTEVARRPFGGSFVWYDEFVGYLLVWLTLLGAVLARSHHQHIGVENLVERASGRVKQGLTLAGHLVMILVHLVLLVYGWQLTARFLSERAITVDVPIGFVYGVIPFSAALMLLVEAIALARLFGRSG